MSNISGWLVRHRHAELEVWYKHISHSDVYGRHPIVFIAKPVEAETCSTHVKVKVTQSRYRPGVAQRVPGS